MKSPILLLFLPCIQLQRQLVVAEDIDATLLQASYLLASVGVTDLCHPTRDDLPGFSRCDLSVAATPKAPRGAIHRSLEYKYEYDDDAKYQEEEETQEEIKRESIISFYFHLIGGILCVGFGGIASGLTVGLLSLDPLLLLIKSRGSSEESAEEKRYAEALLPVIRQHHLLLVTLLLLNTIAGEALPMFLNDLVPEWMAVIMSVVLVLFFGEILPSALFTGPDQMKMAASWVPSVKCIMWFLWPISYPIARLLDKVLDHEDEAAGPLYNRGELAAMIRIQYEERIAAKQRRNQALQTEHNDDIMSPMMLRTSVRDLRQNLIQQPSIRDLRQHPHQNHHNRSASIHLDEVMIAEGALNMKTRMAVDLHVSYRKVFSVPVDTVLNEENITKIYSSGYSRIPVYEGDDSTRIRGIMMTRQLIVVKADANKSIKDLPLHVPHCVGPHTNLVELVNQFQTGGSVTRRGGHLALVCAQPDIGNHALENDEAVPAEAGLMGIITLEDVLEALLQEQIYDENDALGRGVQSLEIAESDVSDKMHHLA